MPLTRPTLLANSSLEGRSKNDLLEIIINYIKNRATVTDLNLLLDILEDPSLMTYQRIATDERDGFFIQAAYIALALSLNERKISAFFGHKTTSSITLKNIISHRLGRFSRGLYPTSKVNPQNSIYPNLHSICGTIVILWLLSTRQNIANPQKRSDFYALMRDMNQTPYPLPKSEARQALFRKSQAPQQGGHAPYLDPVQDAQFTSAETMTEVRHVPLYLAGIWHTTVRDFGTDFIALVVSLFSHSRNQLSIFLKLTYKTSSHAMGMFINYNPQTQMYKFLIIDPNDPEGQRNLHVDFSQWLEPAVQNDCARQLQEYLEFRISIAHDPDDTVVSFFCFNSDNTEWLLPEKNYNHSQFRSEIAYHRFMTTVFITVMMSMQNQQRARICEYLMNLIQVSHVQIQNDVLVSNMTILITASVCGYTGIVVEALKCPNPQLNTIYDGRAPLQCAVSNSFTEIVQILIIAGADVELKIKNATALYLATLNENVEIISLLLGAGADVNTDYRGETPLAVATRLHNVEICSMLRSAGARG